MRAMMMHSRGLFFCLSSFICFFFASAVCVAAPSIDHDSITLQTLNKTTARTSTFDMKIGETVRIGPLYVRPQACRTALPTEEPEAAGFIQVWSVEDHVREGDEVSAEQTEGQSVWVFSGWMFASSPGLSSMDHAIYDLWVLKCGEDTAAVSQVENQDLERGEIPSQAQSDMPDSKADEIIISGDTPLESESGMIIDNSEDLPIVTLNGQDITVVPPLQGSQDEERFQAYDDEDQSLPTVILDE